MEQEMDDLEFLLPSELLTDDVLLCDFSSGFGNSGCLSSDLVSPVESVNGHLETGSDDDDVVAELTRKLTRSSLLDSGSSCDCTAKGLKLSGSPQSTLYDFKLGSKGSSNFNSRASSPLEDKNAVSWNLLRSAAEEVARMRMIEDSARFYPNELLPVARKSFPVTAPQSKPTPDTVFHSLRTQTDTHPSYHQLQAAKIQQMKQNHFMMMMMTKNGFNGQGSQDYQLRDVRRDAAAGDRAYGLSMPAWPSLQQSLQQTGSGIKPVFVAETVLNKERVGTGVFMPRRFDQSPIEARKKPGNFINPNVDTMDDQFQAKATGNFAPDYDAMLRQRNHLISAACQGRNLRTHSLVNQELRLPQEWTY